MPSSGPNYAGSGASNGSLPLGATVGWNFPGNITSSNNAYAAATSSGVTYFLEATNFGFSIPSSATIDGIVVEFERYADGGIGDPTSQDNEIYIIKGGTIGSTNRSAGATWSATESFVSFGSSTDKWGETWTPANINASSFGVALSASVNGIDTIHVDSVRITVYYTDSGITMQATCSVQTSVSGDMQDGAPKLIGTIVAPSTVTGSLAGDKTIAGTITAVSNIPNNELLRLKDLTFDAIVAVSSVTATIDPNTTLHGGTIPGVSSITAAMSGDYVLQGTITGQSTSDGTLVLFQQLLQVSVAGVSNVTATTLYNQVDLAATAAAVAGCSGSIVMSPYRLGATSGAVSSITAALSADKPLISNISGVSIVTSKIDVIRPFAGSLSAQSALPANLSYQASLVGTITDTTSIAATLGKLTDLASSVTGTTSVTGVTSTTRNLGGSITTVSSITGVANRDRGLSGLIESFSAMSAVPSRDRGLITQVTSISINVGRLSGDWPLAGSIQCVSNMSGQVDMRHPLKSSVTALSTMTGVARVDRTLVSNGLIVGSTALASLGLIRDLQVAISSSSFVTGSFINHWYASASAAAIASVNGIAYVDKTVEGSVAAASFLAAVMAVNRDLSVRVDADTIVIAAMGTLLTQGPFDIANLHAFFPGLHAAEVYLPVTPIRQTTVAGLTASEIVQ